MASLHPACIECSANDVITNAGQVLHTTAADQHNGVLLQVMPFSRNVGVYFHSVGEAYTSHLPQSRVRLLRAHRPHACADPSSLRTAMKRRGFNLLSLLPSPILNQLVDGWHFDLFRICLLLPIGGRRAKAFLNVNLAGTAAVTRREPHRRFTGPSSSTSIRHSRHKGSTYTFVSSVSRRSPRHRCLLAGQNSKSTGFLPV